MPHSAVYEVIETIPAHTHATWCRAHDEEADTDQTCRTQAVKFASTTTGGMVIGHVAVTLEQIAVFDDLTDSDIPGMKCWNIRGPQIELSTIRNNGDISGSVWISPGTARRLAATLIDLADRADDETGRADR